MKYRLVRRLGFAHAFVGRNRVIRWSKRLTGLFYAPAEAVRSSWGREADFICKVVLNTF